MVAATKKKEEAYPWKAGASSSHITNLKQSILKTFNIYGWVHLGHRDCNEHIQTETNMHSQCIPLNRSFDMGLILAEDLKLECFK